jgi:hypothetical protein
MHLNSLKIFRSNRCPQDIHPLRAGKTWPSGRQHPSQRELLSDSKRELTLVRIRSNTMTSFLRNPPQRAADTECWHIHEFGRSH